MLADAEKRVGGLGSDYQPELSSPASSAWQNLGGERSGFRTMYAHK